MFFIQPLSLKLNLIQDKGHFQKSKFGILV